MAGFKNHLLVVVGFAIAGMIGAAFGTGTAQAVVATLVEVVNPSTSPVPTSVVNATTSPVASLNVTDPARIPYQSVQTAANCNFFFPTVPANHRVVIQHISGSIGFSGTPTQLLITIVPNNTDFANFFVLIPTIPGFNFTAFDQAVLLYADSSNAIQVVATVYSSGQSATCFGASKIVLTGYEIDCGVASCAPIAAQ